ncbi:MAG: pentapeptide repeat-containing protein, partial [Halobacteriota archaeon]
MSAHVTSKPTEPQQCQYISLARPSWEIEPGDTGQCAEPVYANGRCILHIDLPDDEKSAEYTDLVAKKYERIAYKAAEDDFNFAGAILPPIDDLKLPAHLPRINFSTRSVRKLNFDNATIKGHAAFDGATVEGTASFFRITIEGPVTFRNATIKGSAAFGLATIKGDAYFDEATISMVALFSGATFDGEARFEKTTMGGASFSQAKFEGGALFDEATVESDAFFDDATFKKRVRFDRMTVGRDVTFENATFEKDTSLENATIKGNTSFCGASITGSASLKGATLEGDASFDRAHLTENVAFERCEVRGGLTFKNTTFLKPYSQEVACRAAKQNWEKAGDRATADSYHYLEMEAKRKQKPSWKRYPELPAQYIFGYGVHPWRV